MSRLECLKAHGIQFHCQVVLCPGWNDGEILRKTLNDLESLMPSALSVALVPVGMTAYRDGLEQLKPYTKDSAKELLDMVKPYQEHYLATYGTRFVFPSDEFYCLSGEEIPEDEHYEDYPQIENGVGLVRQFWQSVEEAHEDIPSPAVSPRKVTIACGVSFAPHLRSIVDKFVPKSVDVTVVAVENEFFGKSITVTGLLTGRDLIANLKDIQTDEFMICESMLRNEGDLFLDDMSLDEVRSALPAPLTVCPNDGYAFYKLLCGMEG